MLPFNYSLNEVLRLVKCSHQNSDLFISASSCVRLPPIAEPCFRFILLLLGILISMY